MQSQTTNRRTKFKVVLVGDGGTGKTTYIHRILDGVFIKEYVATCGAEVYNIKFNTNHGFQLEFDVWDTAGQELKSMLRDAYYIGSDAAMIFFDVTSKITFVNVPNWLRSIQAVCFGEQQIPIVLCGNKVDCSNRKVKEQYIARSLKSGIFMYTEISAKTNYNFELPFLALARKLTGIENLTFVSNLNLKPAEIQIDPKSIEESRRVMEELQKSRDIDLPDEEFL